MNGVAPAQLLSNGAPERRSPQGEIAIRRRQSDLLPHSLERLNRGCLDVGDAPLTERARLGSVSTVRMMTPSVDVFDPDEAGATYRVSLRRDAVGSEVVADQELAGDDLTGNGTVHFNQFQYIGGEEYFLVQVVHAGMDGADRVWTAPVWIVPATNDDHPDDDGATPPPPTPHPDEFVRSVNSQVFHLARCRVVPQIAPANRQSGHTSPAGRRLHTGCPQ